MLWCCVLQVAQADLADRAALAAEPAPPEIQEEMAPEEESVHDRGSEEDLWACHPSPSPAHAYNTHMSACMRLCVLTCQDSFISGGPAHVDVVVELTYLRVYMCIYIHMCPGSPCFQEGLQGVYMYIKGLLQFRRSCKCRWRL